MAASPDPCQPAGPPFDRWVGARAPALSRFAYVLTGSPAEADAAVQDALTVARLRWRRLATDPDVEARVRALVVRAYLRRHRRWSDTAAATGPDADDPWLPVSAAAQPDEGSTRIWRRCAALSPRQRAALVLACWEGLGTEEIAEAAGGRRRAAAADRQAALDAVLPGAEDPRTRREHVRRALRQYAEAAPQAYAPAERAVAGAHGRRRRHAAAAVACAAALAVPAAWEVWRGGAGPDPAARDRPSSASGHGWRWESWGGVQVRVPRGWGHADLTQWCVEEGPSGPAVDRPELHSTRAMCSVYDDGRPTYTGGLLLRRAHDPLRLSRGDVAPYATARIHTVGDVTLTVVDVDPTVGSAVLASARVVGRRDAHGCPPHLARGAGAGEVAALVDVDAVSVCRYGLTGWDRPTLISSRRLVHRRADDVLHGVRHAPVGPPTRAGCRRLAVEVATLVLWHDGHPTTAVVRYDGCRRHGLADGVHHRRLTGEVLAPILVPPWTGQLAPDVQRSMAPHGEHPDPEDSIRPAAPGGRLLGDMAATARGGDAGVAGRAAHVAPQR